MNKTAILIFLVLWIALIPNQSYSQNITDTIFDRYANEDFAFGADISWGGSNLKDKNGVPKDLLSILKDQGLNSVRYRVWYPANGPSGKNEVVRNAIAAHSRGFKVMIDFHYSDSWADPGKQYIPSAWEGHTTDQLVQDVYNHTYDVLKALKDAGVTPAWVQIGNETKRGMLWPNGNTNDTPGGMDNFARMINSGYDAIKAVDSTIQAIVHLPDADENSLYRWMFDALKNRGARWDIIGMSAYPRWAHLDADEEIRQSVHNMKDMIARYNTKVMVVETGHYWYEPYISNNFLVELMDTMMTFGGLGCFFWEPQAMFGYELTAWDPATRQPTIAMDAYLGIKHTNPAEVIHLSLDEPLGGNIYEPGETINLSASASHQNGEIASVSFYLDGTKIATITEEPYVFELTSPGVGNYTIYATATDNNGITVNSDEVIIQVGVAAIFQENADGYCGITDDAGSVDTDHNSYTGAGFINTDNETGATVNWTVNFVEAGTYQIDYRYAATSNRPGKLIIDDTDIGNLNFGSTGSWDVWAFNSKNYTVTKTGAVPISLKALTTDGLPNIDYMSIKSIGSSTKPEASGTCLEHGQHTSLKNQFEASKYFQVYSVPDRKIVHVKYSGNMDMLIIYSVDGTVVKTIPKVNSDQIEVSYNDLSRGIYLIQMIKGNHSYVRKFNVQ